MLRIPRYCGSWLACDDGLPAGTSLPDTPQSNCGSGLAREGGLTADQNLGSDRVHIHYLGNGCLWFRFYSQPFQGLFVLAALIIRSVETCAFTAVPLTHVLGLGTLGPRGLFATCLGWIFLASANKC